MSTPTIHYCDPCVERGRDRVLAAIEIGDEWWCQNCYEAQSDEPERKAEPTFLLIKEDQIPLSKQRSVMYQAIMSLRKAEKGVAVAITLNGYKQRQMQHHVHEYAQRYGVSIATRFANGVLYVQKLGLIQGTITN